MADRVCTLILSSDLPAIDIEIERNKVRERCTTTCLNFNRADMPVSCDINGHAHCFWYQTRISGTQSGLAASPDFLITDSDHEPSSHNVVGFIECKARGIGAALVRELFGTAYDVMVRFGLLVTLHRPRPGVVGAMGLLGLDVISIPCRSTDLVVIPTKKTRLLEILREGLQEAEASRKFATIERMRQATFDEKERRRTRR